MENRKPNIMRKVGIEIVLTVLLVGAIILFARPQTASQEFFYGVLTGLAIVFFGAITFMAGKSLR